MQDPVIRIKDLSKSYRLGETVSHDTLRDALAHGFRAFFSGAGKPDTAGDDEFWALNDVSFDVDEGEVVGIIGRNGAGKSTLLKILSRITEPTWGEVRLRGRVASLLEVGTGFHPELTGRENIYLNGTILGMSRAEVAARFDSIVEFAEVERFLDTPVKRYSSGMYVRLAFAVAAHLEPEILVVDEVLSVGDAQFQKKCLGKMKDVSEGGRTVLFVSHNMAAVQSLCGRAVLLDEGRVKDIGEPVRVVARYLDTGAESGSERVWGDGEDAPGNEHIRIRSARVVKDGTGGEGLTVRTPFVIETEFTTYLPEANFYVGMHLKTRSGECVFVTASRPGVTRGGTYRCACYIPGDLLNNGAYTTEFYFVRDGSVVLYQAQDLVSFEVRETEREAGSWMGHIPGAVRPRLRWTMEGLS